MAINSGHSGFNYFWKRVIEMKKNEKTETIVDRDDKYGVTREEAYQLLGVNESSTVEEIEKAYERIAIKNKSLVKQNITTEETDKYMNDCTEAYNLLTQRMTKEERANEQKWFVGFNFKSVVNYFYVYGWQTAIVLAIVVVVTWFAYDITHKEEYDLQVESLGTVAYDSEKLQELFIQLEPSLTNPTFRKGVNSGATEEEAAMQSDQRSDDEMFAAKYIARNIDIVLLNEFTYNRYSPEGYFLDLSDIVKGKKVKTYTSKHEDGRIDGISASKNKHLKDIVYGDDVIMAVCANSENLEKTLSIVNKLVE